MRLSEEEETEKMVRKDSDNNFYSTPSTEARKWTWQRWWWWWCLRIWWVWWIIDDGLSTLDAGHGNIGEGKGVPGKEKGGGCKRTGFSFKTWNFCGAHVFFKNTRPPIYAKEDWEERRASSTLKLSSSSNSLNSKKKHLSLSIKPFKFGRAWNRSCLRSSLIGSTKYWIYPRFAAFMCT